MKSALPNTIETVEGYMTTMTKISLQQMGEIYIVTSL
jgi:hypothetical protein